jgi:hypothetical protein
MEIAAALGDTPQSSMVYIAGRNKKELARAGRSRVAPLLRVVGGAAA